MVCVSAKAGAFFDAVFVDNTEGTKAIVLRGEVGGKRESVEGVQPAVVGMASCVPGAWGYFHAARCG